MNKQNDNIEIAQAASTSDGVLLVDYQHWVNLADSSDRQQYFESWLSIITASIGSVSVASVMLRASSGLYAIASWPGAKPRVQPELTDLCEEAWTERRALVAEPQSDPGADSQIPATLLAYPLILDDGVNAVIALRVGVVDDDALALVLQQLQLGSAWLELLFRREESVADGQLVDQAISTLSLLTKVSAHSESRDAATELVTALATGLGCERVMLGMRKKNDIGVIAISNSGQFGRKMNLVKLAEQAMLEAIDQSAGLRVPDQTGNAGQVVLRHKALMEESKATAVMTIPFYRNNRWSGALLLEKSDSSQFTPEEYDLIETTVSIAGGLVADKQRAERSVLRVCRDRFTKYLKNTFRIRYPVRTAVFVGFLAAVLFGALVEGGFTIKGRANLEGLVERSVVAPFDGYIELSNKRVGDQVKSGEVLGQMDTSSFDLELIELTSKKAQAQSQIRESQATGNRAQVNIIQTQEAQIDAQIALLNRQIDRTALTAPYDGYIVRGDLSRELGAAITRGEIMYVIAPLQQYRVVMQVSEKDISHVSEGSKAQLILSALPEEVIDTTVSRITPVAAAAEGINAFRVEAELSDQAQQLRPGMQGIVRIDGGKRKWIWIWTREFTDWARVAFWRWMP